MDSTFKHSNMNAIVPVTQKECDCPEDANDYNDQKKKKIVVLFVFLLIYELT